MKIKAPLSQIEISSSALHYNLDNLKKLAGQRMFSISVKANGYGHGLTEIVTLVNKRNDVDYLTVHSIEEAIQCRNANWRKKILLLGPLADDDLNAIFEFDLEPVITNKTILDKMGKLASKYKIKLKTHLKLETGTNRQGITDSELPQFAEIYDRHKNSLELFGASMHFANIEDTTNHSFAEYQLKEFHRLTKLMQALKIKPKVKHTAASAGLILFDKTRFDLVRPGIAVYGCWPSKETYLSYKLDGGENNLLKPVLSWYSRITQIKDIPTDAYIGYGCTYKTTTQTKLAIIPVGYYDGYNRNLSNRAYVLINGQRAPIRGRVCMNIIMADITAIKSVSVGDKAVLIGSCVSKDGKKSENILVEQLAEWSGTIHYEFLSRLSGHTKRVTIS